MRKFLTRQDVIGLLKRMLKGKTLAELGRELVPNDPVSPGYLNDVLHGRKPPGKKILWPLGLERETREMYRRSS